MPGRRANGHDPHAEEATEAIIEGDVGFYAPIKKQTDAFVKRG